jgi:transposase InsO family protein
MKVHEPNLLWSTDLTYIPMVAGFMHLTAVIDWYSRYVLSWELSNTMDYIPRRFREHSRARRAGHIQRRSGKSVHQQGVQPVKSGA